jgi:phosphate/sulfate permease
MFFFDMLMALLVALILTAIFAILHRQKAGSLLLLFFAVVFLASWAGGAWLQPQRITAGGLSWFIYLLVGLLVALLLWAIIPPYHLQSRQAKRKESETEPLVIFNLFFWILLIALCIAIIGRYLLPYDAFP